MFKPTDEQMEEWFKPAWEDISMILDELNHETKCGNEYLIYFVGVLQNLHRRGAKIA